MLAVNPPVERYTSPFPYEITPLNFALVCIVKGNPCHFYLATIARRNNWGARISVMKPCITCGTPTNKGTRCEECSPQPKRWNQRGRKRQSTTALGYGHSWRLLSERARRLQPFCNECGATQQLTTDHLPIAHYRQERGLPLRLSDVQVLCQQCNNEAGEARPGSPRYEKWLKVFQATQGR